MPEPKRKWWRKLDNAAKVFPSTVKKSDTRVFRFSAFLHEDVEPTALQAAVDAAITEFPIFLSVMRRGVFWYYLEQSDIKPVIEMENKPPCYPMYDSDKKSLLFTVSYFKSKINLEVYHVLTDGTGAIAFLKAILYYYIKITHAADFECDFPIMPGSAMEQKSADGFSKYYRKRRIKRTRNLKAHILKGTHLSGNGLRIVNADMSVSALSAIAKSHNASITELLTAIFILAIHDNMSLHECRKPIVIGVPVNLRKYFPSDTARNFFGLISVSYNFDKSSDDISEIIRTVRETFKDKLTPEKLSERMDVLIALEHNAGIRIAPLPIKNFAIRTARGLADTETTAVISNVGIISMPDGFERYIKSFGVYASTLKTQLCFCSYKDTLTLGISSAFESPWLEREFISRITECGIEVSISANHIGEE